MNGTDSNLPVEVINLTAGFEDTKVIRNVSMTAPRNQITVILGSSGCGKTTLLKNILRLYNPWSGIVKVFGTDVTNLDETELSDILKHIGVLFQNGALLNSITVAENVAIPLEQHTNLPYSIIQRLIQVKLGLVGLKGSENKLPSELSGGMRKRAALARAIALDPPLLFCDEPSAGLDPITSEALDRLILKMRDELGMTMVIVSHEVVSIERIADRVVFIDKGEVLFEGTLKDAKKSGIQEIDEFLNKGTNRNKNK